MTEYEQQLISSIRDMEKQAPSVGLCAIAFSTIREQFQRVIAERDDLMNYREPKEPKPYKGFCGQCPTCDAVFLDTDTRFCGNCGQALDWGWSDEEDER